jgi:hypothetical protein
MTVLEVLSACRETEAVFRRHGESAGVCVCCNALFETLPDVAHRYGLDLADLMAHLSSAAGRTS